MSDNTTEPWQCVHGSLGRVCPICERDAEILALLAERDALKADMEALTAARDTQRDFVGSLGAVLKKLSFAAQTTGGVAGPDEGLMAAIGDAQRIMSITGVAEAIDRVDSLRAQLDAAQKDAERWRKQLHDVMAELISLMPPEILSKVSADAARGEGK